MKTGYKRLILAVFILVLGSSISGNCVEGIRSQVFDWEVVVNNGFIIPGHDGGDGGAIRYYNSYNPPSVNANGLVVFRARSTGRQQGPVSGIYTRDMSTLGPVNRIADRDTEVPWPNNTEYPVPGGGNAWRLSSFNEFPSFPRIALSAAMVASRGNHKPVWTYEEPGVQFAAHGGDEDEDETRAGTTGVYVNLQAGYPVSELTTGASLLGATPEYWSLFQVPGVELATRFDVFPGAPAITNDGVVAFKANYTGPDGGKTGIFYRQLADEDAGGYDPIHLVANSDTAVPNQGECAFGTTFGSTAPPSVAGDQVVFVGSDNEWDPTCGGIYAARLDLDRDLDERAQLATLVGLEDRVPRQGRATFSELGEGLSYDGRFVAFWATWGDEEKTVRLYCPQEGNRIRRHYCNHTGQFAPDATTGESLGDVNSVCEQETERCYQDKEVPVNQGIFVYDTFTENIRLLARTGQGGAFNDFVYWNYSGAPPGAGESEGHAEPPRFRSSAFVAVTSRVGGTSRTVFLARKGETDNETHVYIDPVDGLYLATQLGAADPWLTTLLQTGMDGTILDLQAVWDDDEDPSTPEVPLPIASLGLERDGLRGDWLAITASMGVEEAGWSGIYLTHMPVPPGQ